jgi:hypothetical protein
MGVDAISYAAAVCVLSDGVSNQYLISAAYFPEVNFLLRSDTL